MASLRSVQKVGMLTDILCMLQEWPVEDVRALAQDLIYDSLVTSPDSELKATYEAIKARTDALEDQKAALKNLEDSLPEIQPDPKPVPEDDLYPEVEEDYRGMQGDMLSDLNVPITPRGCKGCSICRGMAEAISHVDEVFGDANAG